MKEGTMEICVQFPNDEQFSEEVPNGWLAQPLFDWYHAPAPRPSLGNFLSGFIPTSNKQHAGEQHTARVIYPNIQVVYDNADNDWTVIQATRDERNCWFYYHKDIYVPIPEGCEAENDGTISCSFENYTLRVSPRFGLGGLDQGWPWVLLNPRVWVALEQLKQIAQRGQTRNLWMLVTTDHQPCKGTAIKLRGKIEQVIRMFTEALTGDRF